MTKELLLAKLNKFCPPWLERPNADMPMGEMLQFIIRQVLPGLLDVKIESIGPDKVVGSVAYKNQTANVLGYMHGGTIFAAGDTLAGAFLWYISDVENFAVTVRSEIRYLKSFKTGTLYCTVKEKERHGRKVTLEALFNDEGNQAIAQMELDYMLMSLPKENS
jgi:uncharacterized protein (TIGR00369 family)